MDERARSGKIWQRGKGCRDEGTEEDKHLPGSLTCSGLGHTVVASADSSVSKPTAVVKKSPAPFEISLVLLISWTPT